MRDSTAHLKEQILKSYRKKILPFMKIKPNHWLLTKPIAHRGLWGNEIIENSLTAYQNAVDNGYPIEIDLHLSTDGVLFSFHDNNLKRMTGVNKCIHDLSSSEIKSYFLSNSEHKIPTFDEVLEIAQGKVPLLIEIKNQPNKLVVDKTVERLLSYNGEFAIQSFNPLYIARVKKLAPNFIRGVLATKRKIAKTKFSNFVINHMPFNFLAKPDFISYDYMGLPIKKRKAKNLPIIAWTIKNKDAEIEARKYAENIIFELYDPTK